MWVGASRSYLRPSHSNPGDWTDDTAMNTEPKRWRRGAALALVFAMTATAVPMQPLAAEAQSRVDREATGDSAVAGSREPDEAPKTRPGHSAPRAVSSFEATTPTHLELGRLVRNTGAVGGFPVTIARTETLCTTPCFLELPQPWPSLRVRPVDSRRWDPLVYTDLEDDSQRYVIERHSRRGARVAMIVTGIALTITGVGVMTGGLRRGSGRYGGDGSGALGMFIGGTLTLGAGIVIGAVKPPQMRDRYILHAVEHE